MTQPTLPVPVSYSEIEIAYMDEEPPGLWPENQDSNFGTHRKVFCDELMIVAGQLDLLLNEKFLNTSSTFINAHEEELGLTIAPAGKSLAQRRAAALARRKRGPFTNTFLDFVVESFILATFGSAPAFGTSGLVLGAGGIPLFSGATGDPKQYYRIYFDIRNFTYAVWIKNTILPDVGALTRELLRVTPSGITFTIDATKVNVLDYFNTIRNNQPVHYAPQGGSGDSSGYGNIGTANGGVITGGVAALRTLTGNDDNGATAYDGVNDSITIPDALQEHVRDNFSFEAWINVPDFTATRYLVDYGVNSFAVYLTTGGNITLAQKSVGDIVTSTIALAANTTYHVVITKNATDVHIYINGVDQTGVVTNRTLVDNTAAKAIGMALGSTNFFKGTIDELAVYNFALTADQVTKHYKTGTNVL